MNTTDMLHRTSIHHYEDLTAPYGITHWCSWECTCGDGEIGLGEVTAFDVATTHETRYQPCTCGDPAVVDVTPAWSQSITYRALCDCGFVDTFHVRKYNVHAPRRDARTVAYTRAAAQLAAHSCRSVCGHTHEHPAPTLRTMEAA